MEEDIEALTPTSSKKVLPPIQSPTITPDPDRVWYHAAVQTDISMLIDSGVSSFRPSYLPQDDNSRPDTSKLLSVSASAPMILTQNEVVSKTGDGDSTLKTMEQVSNEESSSKSDEYEPDFLLSEESEVLDDYQSTNFTAISDLKGVGPPTILQYVKESERVKRIVPPPPSLADRFPSINPDVVKRDRCPFCNTELLPVPPLSDTSEPEDEEESAALNVPLLFIKDLDNERQNPKGIQTPPQKQAGETTRKEDEVKPDEEDSLPGDGFLYCCEDYYWHLVNRNRMQRRNSFFNEGEASEIKKIDVSPHAPFGSKKDRKLAKQRAFESTSAGSNTGQQQKRKIKVKSKPKLTPLTQLVREREIERIRPMGGAPRIPGGGPPALFGYARQMKTINFSLSSKKCQEDGWTVDTQAPVKPDRLPILYDTFEETQTHPIPGLSVPWQQTAVDFHRYYDTGQVFITLLPDGTGTCYYPSGNPAVVIALEQPGIFCYYVLSDEEEDRNKLLCICSQSGRYVVYNEKQQFKYIGTPVEGHLFNNKQVRVKHWKWNAFTPHVHAPPFQPCYFQISPYFSMRSVDIDRQTLVFQYRKYSFKCAVGARTKRILVEPIEKPEFKKYFEDLENTRQTITAAIRKLNDTLNTVEHRVSPTKSEPLSAIAVP